MFGLTLRQVAVGAGVAGFAALNYFGFDYLYPPRDSVGEGLYPNREILENSLLPAFLELVLMVMSNFVAKTHTQIFADTPKTWAHW